MDENERAEEVNVTEELEKIITACRNLGWSIGIPNTAEDAVVTGMIIGTDEYLNEVIAKLNE